MTEVFELLTMSLLSRTIPHSVECGAFQRHACILWKSIGGQPENYDQHLSAVHFDLLYGRQVRVHHEAQKYAWTIEETDELKMNSASVMLQAYVDVEKCEKMTQENVRAAKHYKYTWDRHLEPGDSRIYPPYLCH